ncbi:NTF2-like domain containing protein [Trema orientale]|uniref:NTF2-like domain containing protein n=1 Tax=Trema orientale TaxID=63057 RepID=A0A2P5FPE0_TREOI|nr:NTF2-like domain containing protein [Trema orientale]
MASSVDDGKKKYRSFLYDEGEKNTTWRFGEPPTYDVVNKLFGEGKTKAWPPGSLEEMVQNLVKTWEMEIFHKASVEDFKVIDQSFTYSLNGRKALTLKEVAKLWGGYNPHLQTSLPEHLRIYNPAEESSDSSHRAFTTTFPRGFALEVLQVYCGPPEIVFKFRHWGFMEGPFKGYAPTGEMIELFGIAVLETGLYVGARRRPYCRRAQIVKVEFFYDRGELLGKLVKGERLETNDGEVASSCPILKNTG